MAVALERVRPTAESSSTRHNAAHSPFVATRDTPVPATISSAGAGIFHGHERLHVTAARARLRLAPRPDQRHDSSGERRGVARTCAQRPWLPFTHHAHHVYTLAQTHGSKTWDLVYPRDGLFLTPAAQSDPQARQYTEDDLEGLQRWTFNLTQGDTLVVPRGFIHRAISTGRTARGQEGRGRGNDKGATRVCLARAAAAPPLMIVRPWPRLSFIQMSGPCTSRLGLMTVLLNGSMSLRRLLWASPTSAAS